MLHEEIAAKIGGLIERGTYRSGERIPSVRELSRKMRVSINTVMEAYAHLENMRIVEARPKSGYYVRSRLAEPETPAPGVESKENLTPCPVAQGEVPLRVMRSLSRPDLIPLGRGVPNPELLPIDRLTRMLAAEARRVRTESIAYAPPAGVKRLRIQIARRSLDAGCALSPDDIVITAGCVEAVTLALQATCRPGDAVAIESPAYYTFLSSLQWLGLSVLEIPSAPRDGMNLAVLDYAIRHNPVRACIVIPNFNTPLGSRMPDDKKRELVELLAKQDIPLIEDDVYGDLSFGPTRPRVCKAWDRKGLVLTCSSFSKTLAPGYRVGWIAAGRYREEVERLKRSFNLATCSPTQLAIAEFLTNGGYDRHLRSIRRACAERVAQLREAVGLHFPLGTRVTRPEGGYVLWVEMPQEIDSFRLYEEALQAGIGIAPGMLFTTGDKFRNCIRLNAAFWSPSIERAVEVLGRLAIAQSAGGRVRTLVRPLSAARIRP